jgi:glycosyltransferase involved in cell wall biosynthesis
MRVTLDLRPLQVGHENRGIGNYLSNILQHFPVENDSVEYIFIRYNKSNPISDLNLPFQDANYREIILTERKFGKRPLQIFLFIAELFNPIFLRVILYRPDIFIQPDYLFGVPRAPWIQKVVIAYDLIPLIFKGMYIPSWKLYAGQRQRRIRNRLRMSLRAYYHERRYNNGLKTLKKADKIVSISQTTTNDIKKIAKVDARKIRTIYLAPSFTKSTTRPDKLKSMKSLEKISGRYLFFIGGTDPRREVHELVYAHNILNSRGIDFHLVLAGNEFIPESTEISVLAKRAIESSSYSEKIHLLGKVDEIEKKFLFENAFAFVFPTLYEGFGLPLLESMECKTPVVAYANAATKEIAGDAAIYPHINNGYGIYTSITMLLDSAKNTSGLIKRGTRRVSDFNWDTTGQKTVDFIFKEK